MAKLTPQPRPVPQSPGNEDSKTGRDDGTEGQAGVGFELEDSPNPLVKK
jgi:hypothetical protein